MPGINGYALVARLRAKWPSMPVILTTGYLSQDAAKNMLNGSVDFIPKPIDPETLMKMIKYHVPLSSPLQQPQLHSTDAPFSDLRKLER